MEELRAIRRIWVFDKHEFDDSLPAIFEGVTGKKFLDPEWVGSEAFRKDEWDVLKSVCEDLFPEEELTFEMLYSMIPIFLLLRIVMLKCPGIRLAESIANYMRL